ncbi:MAG TPA: hypothetical protein DCW31_00560 [Lactobacillus sp.]|nr:hypothetical protein [Lactobacillus sp.]
MKEYGPIHDVLLLKNLSTKGFTSGFDWQFELRERQVIGLKNDGQLAGLISFEHSEDYTHVGLIEVAKSFRLKGCGAILLSLVMREAIRRPHDGGYVNLRTKTNGVQLFYLHMGAMWIAQTMIFTPDVSQKNVDKYLAKGWNL